MLKTRVITAVIFVPILLLGAWIGGLVFTFLMMAVSIIAGIEFANMLKGKDLRFPLVVYICGTVLLFLAAGILSARGIGLLAVSFCYFIVSLFLFVWNKLSIEEAGLSVLAFVYTGLFPCAMVIIRLQFLHGLSFILLIFLVQWMTDTGAYFVGRAFGKHKLAPAISPKKTVEGAVGGVVIAIVSAVIFNVVVDILPLLTVILLALIGSVVGQLGDLTESAIKRWAGVKDAGKILPGHGGILDRFDSLLLMAPFFLILLSLATNYIQ